MSDATRPPMAAVGERVSADDLPRQENVGAALRRAREKRGFEIERVAADLRIREAFLRELESGRYGALPGLPYAQGFVRAYAEYLDLDAGALLERFKGETQGQYGRPRLVAPKPVQGGRRPGLAIVLGSILFGAIVYGAWYYYNSLTDGGTAVRAGSSGTLAVAPPAPSEVPPTVAEVPAPPATKDAPPAEEGRGRAPVSASGVVTLRANALVWVQLRDRGGKIVLERVMGPGTAMVVDDPKSKVLFVGNAGGLVVELDGRVLKPLGAPGAPANDVALDPEELKKRP